MSSHAHTYCKALSALPAPDAINSIHSAYLQLLAVEKGLEGLDNGPIMRELHRLLALSGHIGFDSPGHALPVAPVKPGKWTQKELEEAFERVSNRADWKAPIAANVLGSQMDVTIAAIVHFTATNPRTAYIGYNEACQTIYHVTSIGYRAGPAGDH